MLLILFGLSGSGKNFVGEILSSTFGYHFWDADTEMPSIMQQQILKKDFFTQEMRDDFTEIIIKKIAYLKQNFSKIVVSQALYKEQNRQQIVLTYPEAQFLLIKATQANIMRRLEQRNNWVDPHYAEKMSYHFEYPRQPDAIIINETNAAAIVEQMECFLSGGVHEFTGK